MTVPPQRFHAFADHSGFFIGVPQSDHAHFLAGGIPTAGTQGLSQPPFIVRDQCRGSRQYRRRRSVIRFQTNDRRAGKILLEPKDVFHLRAAPGIDRLIVVADAANVAVCLRQQPQPQILHQVGVLVLIDQNVTERAVILRQHIRLSAQNLRHVQQQIAEIRRVHRGQPRLIGGIHLTRPPGGEIGVLGRRDPRRRQPAILPALDQPHHCRRRPTLRVDALRFHHLLQQPKLVVSVQDGEARRQRDKFGMSAQHPRAQRVEGAEPQPLDRPRQDGADPFAHLASRLVGERHRQHLAGESAAGQQDMREPRGQHPRLAGAGAGQHQHRPVNGLDGRALFGVQPGQVVGHQAAEDGTGRTPRIWAIA